MKQSDNKQDKHYSQEDIEKLSQKMDEDIEGMLHTSEPMKSHKFSLRYEVRLARSLRERFGAEKTEKILEQRHESRKKSGAKASKHYRLFLLKSREKLFGQSLKEKISHFPFSGFAQVAAVLLIVVLVTVTFGKNEAKASWWENLQFIIRSYKEYSQIEAYEEVDEGNITYPQTIEKKYIPTKVAEGYEEVARDNFSKQVRIIYMDNENNIYTYMQQTQDMGQHINTEDTKYEDIDSSYGRAYYCENEGEFQIYWDYEGYIFSIQGNLELNDMLEIVDSVRGEDKERNQ